MMFREMKGLKQLLSNEETMELLRTCNSGVLGVIGDDGYPYTVPISYAFHEDKLFFRSAKEGHKIDSIRKNDKVTFCCIEDDAVQNGTFTTRLRSVSLFGKARILTDDTERQFAMDLLMEKYAPADQKEEQPNIQKDWSTHMICLVEIKIEHMTGKAVIEVLNHK